MNEIDFRFAIRFSEWIAANHYRLINVIDYVYYWQNEEGIKTTNDLMESYRYEERL